MSEKKSFFESKRNVVLIAILYTFLWGSAFPLVKLCMESFTISDSDNMSKCLVAGIRFAFSGLFTLVWCAFTDETKISIAPSQFKHVLFYGLLATALQYSFTYIGLSRIDGSKGAIFDQLCVFIIVLASGIFFKDDRLSLKKIAGCILGFLGVFAINTTGVSFEFSFGGEGIMICAALCQTASYFVAKNTAETISAPKLVGYGQLIGGILLCIFAVIAGGRIQTINITAVVTLLALIAISAIAYVLSLMPLKYFPASEVSSFNLLITVFGVVMSALVLGEDIFRWNYLVSLILISAGIIAINYKRNKL